MRICPFVLVCFLFSDELHFSRSLISSILATAKRVEAKLKFLKKFSNFQNLPASSWDNQPQEVSYLPTIFRAEGTHSSTTGNNLFFIVSAILLGSFQSKGKLRILKFLLFVIHSTKGLFWTTNMHRNIIHNNISVLNPLSPRSSMHATCMHASCSRLIILTNYYIFEF